MSLRAVVMFNVSRRTYMTKPIITFGRKRKKIIKEKESKK